MTFLAPPPPVVIDASFAVEALLGDARFREAWDRWLVDGAETFAPSHFWAEVANALLRSVHLDAAEATAGFDVLSSTGVDTIDRGVQGVRRALTLASSRGLTVYDAMYVDLAVDIDARLATLDRALERAAKAEGVELVSI